MAAYGAWGGVFMGPTANHASGLIAVGSVTTEPFITANEGFCARVMAYDARDFKTVYLYFGTPTTPGTVTLRIETVSTTTGKPTGILYDAAAEVANVTPSAGWNAFTFATLPSAGLTAGTSYAIVLLKDNAGTTCTLYVRTTGSEGHVPTAVLMAADGSTITDDVRTGFAEVAASVPVCFFKMEDDAIEPLGCCGASAIGVGYAYAATNVVAQKIILDRAVVVRGLRTVGTKGFTRIGTPAGDLRIRILDSGNNAVAGSTVTVDLDYLLNSANISIYIPFPNISLAAGTYRIAFDSADSANSSHAFGIRYIVLGDAALQSASFCYSESTDGGSNWTDTATRQVPMGFELDSIADGGGNTIIINTNQ